MRMKVVLPLPFGPRNPKISPVRTCSAMSFTTVVAPKRFVIPRTSIARSSAIIYGANSTSTGWPGCSFTAVAGSNRSSIMKTSLPRLSWL